MSISQLIAQTLMTFKADTSQARAEIKKLTGAEKEAAEASLKAIDKRNAGYESIAKSITKVNAVLATANKVLEVGGEAFKAYEENSRLSLAAANVSIGALRSSSQGLRTDLDLLKLASTGNAAAFKSNQKQLENAAAAMVAFERAGFDASKSTEKVREAILKGNIEPLKELGINLDAAKTKQEQFSQLQTVLAQKAREAGEGHAGAGEAFRRAAVDYDNAMRDIKIALGDLVMSLSPLVSGISAVGKGVAQVIGLIPDWLIAGLAVAGGQRLGSKGGKLGTVASVLTGPVGLGAAAASAFGEGGLDIKSIAQAAFPEATVKDAVELFNNSIEAAKAASRSATTDRFRAGLDVDPDSAARNLAQGRLRDQLRVGEAGAEQELGRMARSGELQLILLGIPASQAASIAAMLKNKKKSKGGEFDFGGTDTQDSQNATIAMRDAFIRQANESARRGLDPGGFGGGEFGGGLAPRGRRNLTGTRGGLPGMPDLEGAAELFNKGVQDSFLAKTFGPISEFDAYAKAFSTLTGSLEAGFSAWIDGSMSAGAAIKKFFSDSIKAMASEMFAKAIQHGAYALGSLAFGDLKGAATHGVAAAKFGAGAVAIGALAKSIGGGSAGGAGAGASGGSAPNVTGSGGSSRPVTSSAPINVYVGDVFADDNLRAKAGRVARAVRSARRAAGEYDSVRWG